MSENAVLPLIVSAGEALTDLVRTGEHSWSSHAGGAGWNVARATRALGAVAAFAGAVGSDVFGADVVAASRAAGLDMRFLQQYPNPTLLAVVYQVNPPAYSFMGENSADLQFDPQLLPTGWLQSVRWLHLGGVSLARPPLSATLVSLAEEAKAAGAAISFDPNARNVHADPAYRPVFERVLGLADLIKFSDEDLRFFFPGASEEEALGRVRELNGHAPIIVTRGGDGASLFSAQERQDLPAPRVQVVDTVGAGDAFVAGLLYRAATASDSSWAERVRFALLVGAAACTRAGAYSPTLSDVQDLIS